MVLLYHSNYSIFLSFELFDFYTIVQVLVLRYLPDKYFAIIFFSISLGVINSYNSVLGVLIFLIMNIVIDNINSYNSVLGRLRLFSSIGNFCYFSTYFFKSSNSSPIYLQIVFPVSVPILTVVVLSSCTCSSTPHKPKFYELQSSYQSTKYFSVGVTHFL